MQPDNEQIIKEISKAEQYLKGLLERLLKLNATPRSLLDVVQALDILGHSYISDQGRVGVLVEHSHADAVPQELSASNIEQIRKAIKDAMSDGINS